MHENIQNTCKFPKKYFKISIKYPHDDVEGGRRFAGDYDVMILGEEGVKKPKKVMT